MLRFRLMKKIFAPQCRSQWLREVKSKVKKHLIVELLQKFIFLTCMLEKKIEESGNLVYNE